MEGSNLRMSHAHDYGLAIRSLTTRAIFRDLGLNIQPLVADLAATTEDKNVATGWYC